MAQCKKVRGVATNIRTEGDMTIVRYHTTDVVAFTPTHIILRNGGHQTKTTKLRMNQAAYQFDLEYHIRQRNCRWYVHLFSGETLDFTDGMKIIR